MLFSLGCILCMFKIIFRTGACVRVIDYGSNIYLNFGPNSILDILDCINYIGF